jgi:DNA-binding transcriptional LysR family regulator
MTMTAAARARSPSEGREAVSVDLLLFFAAVADELSFTRAARRLGIDQSWLSHKIRELESELACTLFSRTTRRIELTSAGAALLGPAQALARAAGEARRAAQAVSAGLQGALRIGALPYSFWNPARVSLIDRFIAQHPETEVEVSNGPSPMLLDRLRRGEIDLAFVSWPFDASGLDLLSVRVDRFCFLIPKDHRLARRSEIRLEDVRGERMAMPSPRHNPHAFASLFQPFIDAGAIPATVAEFQADALFRVARRNGHLVLCNVQEIDVHAGDAFTARPLAGHDAVNHKCLVRPRGRLTPAATAFWTLAVQAGGAPLDLAEQSYPVSA